MQPTRVTAALRPDAAAGGFAPRPHARARGRGARRREGGARRRRERGRPDVRASRCGSSPPTRDRSWPPSGRAPMTRRGSSPRWTSCSKQLRAKIGESLRTVRTSKPLEQVTTGSLEALAKYSQAERAINADGDYMRGLILLQQAIALDTSFAMAYRKLGVVLEQHERPARAARGRAREGVRAQRPASRGGALPDDRHLLHVRPDARSGEGARRLRGAARDPAGQLRGAQQRVADPPVAGRAGEGGRVRAAGGGGGLGEHARVREPRHARSSRRDRPRKRDA